MKLTGNQIELLQEKLAQLSIEKRNPIAAWYALRLASTGSIEYKNDITNDLRLYLESALQIADVSMSILFEDKEDANA